MNEFDGRLSKVIALVALLGALSATGCSSGEPDGSGSPAPLTSAPAGTAGAEAPSALDDGYHFGYITAVDTSERTVTFDLAGLLTGEAAKTAAVEEGVIQPDESLDNDYYISNKSKTLRTLRYTEDVKVRVVDWANCCEGRIDGNIEEFAAAFRPDGKTDRYHGPDSPYSLTIEAGVVVRIREEYFP